MKKKMLFIIVGLFMLFLLASCKPIEVEVTRTVEVTRIVTVEVPVTVTAPSEPDGVSEEPSILSVHRWSLPLETYSLDTYYSTRDMQPDPYVPKELILAGRKTELDILLSISTFDNFEILSEESKIGDNEVYRLIHTGERTVDKAFSDVQDVINRNKEIFSSLLVGRNYLTAAPWDVEASPWDVEASNIDGFNLIDTNTGTLHDLPWNQWAFQEGTGINLFERTGTKRFLSTEEQENLGVNDLELETGRRKITQTGEGIRVFIFDTSPLLQNLEPESSGSFTETLRVRFAQDVLPDIDLVDNERYVGTNEHGLFVAGLVHYVAPEADIELVKILNNQGVGELYTLTTELERLLINNEGDLSNVIINLSLGFHPERLSDEQDTEFSSDLIIQDFEDQLTRIRKARAIIVAAAGNHSSVLESANSFEPLKSNQHNTGDIYEFKNEVEPPLNSNYPARWETVFSVSGYGAESSNLSCFSNEIPGDTQAKKHSLSVRAPSGGGFQQLPTEYEGDKQIVYVCQKPLQACDNDDSDFTMLMDGYSCPYTIVSITTEGYAHWSGTSFGTPIVSGIMALMLEKCNPDGNMTSEQIKKILAQVLDRYYDDDAEKFNVETLLGVDTGCRQ